MIIVIEVIGWRVAGGQILQGSPIDDKNVGPAVVIVVKDGDASASGFDDELFGTFPAEGGWSGEARFLRDVSKVRDRNLLRQRFILRRWLFSHCRTCLPGRKLRVGRERNSKEQSEAESASSVARSRSGCWRRASHWRGGGAGGIRTHEWRFCRPLPWATWVPRRTFNYS